MEIFLERGFCLLSLVESNRNDTVDSGGHIDTFGREIPDNINLLVALLNLNQLVVTLLVDHRLHLLAIHSVLLELLSQLELDLRRLDGRDGLDRIVVTIDDNLQGGRGRLGKVASDKTHA